MDVTRREILTYDSSRHSSVMKGHEDDVISLESIKRARERIRPFVHETPMLTSSFFNSLTGRNLFFKCENLQKAGSFKIRGATNSILRIKEEKADESFVVVTHSSGNHAQGLALAASLHNVKSMILVPNNAPQVKKNAVVGYGATLLECGPTVEERQQSADRVLEELQDGEFIPSADHPFMMEGQGSVGLEMLDQVPELDAVVACCSSGGLLSGIAVACKQSKPATLVFGAEPKSADDTARSLKEKKRIVLTEYPDTIADGLRMGVGMHTWPVIRDNVDDVITVTENEIVRAMFLLWERMKLVVEPSGAVPFAAVLTEQFNSLPKEIQNVGVMVSGGNVDLNKVPWMMHPGKYDLAL